MLTNSFSIGKVLGISLRLHYSWFIIFLLVTFLFTDGVRHVFPLGQSIIGGIVTSLLFFASVVAHELSHSVVARRNGIPVRSITLFIFGGVAQITKDADHPGAEFRMAVAGPLCSFAISAVFFAILFLFGLTEDGVPGAVVVQLAVINVLVGMFNLIPGFPLDGGRVLRSILWKARGNYDQATRVAVVIGRGVAYVFIGVGLLTTLLNLLIPGLVDRLTGGLLNWFNGLWLVLIGWFLQNAASASYRQSRMRGALRGLTAAQVMDSGCIAILPSATVRQVVQEHIVPAGRNCLLVANEGRVEGIISLENIKALPQVRWETTTVKEAMTPMSELRVASPDQDAQSLLDRMEEAQVSHMPVVDNGRVIGLVSRDALLRAMGMRSEPGA